IRYGINGALALSIWLVGDVRWGTVSLFMLCSVAEVVLAYWFANRLWGRAAAIWSSIALATLPVAAHLPGAMGEAPYLALFIELSIVVFYFAQRRDDVRLHFLAGLIAGSVLWIKEVVVVFVVVFPLLAATNRSIPKNWYWALIGGALPVAAHLTFFWIAF